MDPASQLHRVQRVVYRGRIKRLVRWLGLESALSSLYRSVVDPLGGGEVIYRVGEVAATFGYDEHIPARLPEREIVVDLLGRVRPDDVFYDLGANLGIFTCLVGSAVPEGSVYAFEPDPAAVDALRQNVSRNGLDDRVTVTPAAVADGYGRTELQLADESISNTLVDDVGTGDSVEVDLVGIDEFVRRTGSPAPTVAKIDVEGAEGQVLSGMIDALEDSCRLVYCEIHPPRLASTDRSPADVERTLNEAGFEVTRLQERSANYTVRATRR